MVPAPRRLHHSPACPVEGGTVPPYRLGLGARDRARAATGLMLCRDGMPGPLLGQERPRLGRTASRPIVEAALRVECHVLADRRRGRGPRLRTAGRTWTRCAATAARQMLLALDLLEYNGDDLRRAARWSRSARNSFCAQLIGATKRCCANPSCVDHIKGDGPAVFRHACSLGLEGIVSKRMDSALSERTIEDVAQIEEPGQRSGAAGT